MELSYFTNKYHKLYFPGDGLTPEIEAAIPDEYLALFQQGKGVAAAILWQCALRPPHPGLLCELLAAFARKRVRSVS